MTSKMNIIGKTEWACDDMRGYFGYSVHIDNGVWPEHVGFPAFTHEQMLECKRIQDVLDPKDEREEYAHLEYDEERNVWLECWYDEEIVLEPFEVDGVELFALGYETDWAWGLISEGFDYRTV